MLTEKIIEIATALLGKNLPFCIYRLPHKDLSLAIDSELFKIKTEKDFWMMPFLSSSTINEIVLKVTAKDSDRKTFLREIEASEKRPAFFSSLPEATGKKDYLRKIHQYLEPIRSGRIKKAILSRVIRANKPSSYDPMANFLRLEQNYPQAFVYLFSHPQAGLWLGATPELLLIQRDHQYYTSALAGTQRKRGNRDYRWREKEKREHEMVGQHIESVFQEDAFQLIKKDGPKTIETGAIAHLETDYHFKSSTPPSLRTLVSKLHPTPAIAGLPQKESINCILENEGYSRNYYCGFLGETDFEKTADLYVNLRCMQVGESQIAVYAGGGITAASDPEQEWEETQQKGRNILQYIK